MIKEFKEFINKGNVVDLAVGVIVGGAFNKIVSSLVNDIVMPLVGMLIGGHDFSGLAITIGEANIKYGMFIQNIIDFLLVAFSIFMVIKFMNKVSFKKKDEKKKEALPTKPADIALLEEIRDLLKPQSTNKKK